MSKKVNSKLVNCGSFFKVFVYLNRPRNTCVGVSEVHERVVQAPSATFQFISDLQRTGDYFKGYFAHAITLRERVKQKQYEQNEPVILSLLNKLVPDIVFCCYHCSYNVEKNQFLGNIVEKIVIFGQNCYKKVKIAKNAEKG